MSRVVPHARADCPLEVELDADELLPLVRPSATSMPSSAAAIQADQSASANEHCCSRMAFGVGAAVALAILTGLTLYRPAISVPPALDMAMIPEPETVSPPISPEPALPPVKFVNPFDHNEVFEFPAGTSRTEARRKVAELLMERAQGRGRGEGSRRVASAHRAGTASR